MAETERDEYQQGVREMKYFIGFVVGVALTIGGAWLYDNSSVPANQQLVNWTNARGLVGTVVDAGRVQIDRLVKLISG
jgi:hypothetical protein